VTGANESVVVDRTAVTDTRASRPVRRPVDGDDKVQWCLIL